MIVKGVLWTSRGGSFRREWVPERTEGSKKGGGGLGSCQGDNGERQKALPTGGRKAGYEGGHFMGSLFRIQRGIDK